MALISRRNNVLTDKPTLETIFSFGKFPTYVGCVTTKQSDDILLDLTMDICTETGILQLKHLASLDQVYLFPHNDAIGPTWKKHNEEFLEIIEEFSPKKILEIGGGSGKLAKNYTNKNTGIDWTILDPNPLFEENKKIHSLKKYFSSKLILDHDFDAIIHSHVLEHQSSPEQFFVDISKFLILDGLHIFSFPNLQEWLSKKYLNCLNFEHTIFLTEIYVDCILKRTGFKLLKKIKFQDHSIFYVTKYTGKKELVDFPNLYNQNKQIYLDYIKYYKDFISQLNLKLIDFPHKIFIFGAHIFSQYLLALNLNPNKIEGILDNSSLKIGKRLYGTNLTVFDPKIIANKDVGVILKVGTYRNEIIDQLKAINPNVTIFE
jgi:2-polyprenyl-3-methyl-5-hydroxy-6-metoxy-1,4-benzoquinol methylase